MGLDMYLEARTKSGEIFEGYWRKANQIHHWFVDNVQDGVDECQKSPVTFDQLDELREICKEAIRTKNSDLLPPTSGFFFGGTEIDEWYWADIVETVGILSKFIDHPQIDRNTFTYEASW